MIKQHTIDVINHNTLTDLPVLFDELRIDTLNIYNQELITSIEAVLPQTQCGLCNHPEGCLPYAYAIVQNSEMPNKCIPGGQAVTDKITVLLQQEPLHVLPSKWETNLETDRPQEMRAVIREDDCIGCTKCIPACPVDAIIGTGKHMHSIFTDLCTGCELCIAPCPVDCIDLVPIERFLDNKQRETEQHHLRERYHNHLDRVYDQMQDKHNAQPVVSVVESKLSNSTHSSVSISQTDAKYTIATAKLRTKIKKLEKQLNIRDNETKRELLQDLQQELSLLMASQSLTA